jgi:Domain of unknown function (DUF4864)
VTTAPLPHFSSAVILRLIIERFGAAFILSLMLAGPVRADEAADRDAVQAVIADQIDAFKLDDSPRAWGHAAPSIRRMFPSADTFMMMVRRGYAPVYRPQQTTFGSMQGAGDMALQEVFVTGLDGEDWVALYTLERQMDGTWKITGCLLRRAPGSSA